MLVKDLKIVQIGEYHGGGIYEVYVPQDEDLIYVYTTSERSLNWLIANNKDKWEVRYFSSSIREAGENE